jgi:prevent-host-death family protein
MKLTEDIKPVTYMKTRATDLLREVKRSRRPAVITQRGEAQPVVLDVATYEAFRDALLLLQLSQGEADVHAGWMMPPSEVFARARRRLAREGQVGGVL